MKNNDESIINRLHRVSTATIATNLFKRGLKNQFIQKVKPLSDVKHTMVGRAYTLRYIPAREDLNSLEAFKNPRHLQRVAVEECPKNHVLVIDSRKDARAASAGSILITRLMKRGVAGIVTDGGFRDSKEIAELDFPSFHVMPSAPTNLTLHQAIAVNEPIGCGDVAVFPGDFIVGDHDGVMVIPKDIADDVAIECLDMTLYEEFVMETVQQGASVIGLYPLTDSKLISEFELWKSKRNATKNE
ncbi:ribonuclease activity regulator RraA [Flagellimonas sp. HMM57]|uniref:ribonuclease activity regulator RraA n=1 Tax=unclassified Flagellimonas TaxID=2644544 RepID=UPI0013D42A4E|nr:MULTISPECIES: ribonuclease activity regulator RraA [unclassified Flagellimonas]UII76792.1 ribonuclease activity regulator RraA [Flagellimonas sp. HMM57]